jgi:hypothetical protein
MRVGAGQASAQFTLFARLGATGRTADLERLLLFGFHWYTMRCDRFTKMFNCDQSNEKLDAMKDIPGRIRERMKINVDMRLRI